MKQIKDTVADPLGHRLLDELDVSDSQIGVLWCHSTLRACWKPYNCSLSCWQYPEHNWASVVLTGLGNSITSGWW